MLAAIDEYTTLGEVLGYTLEDYTRGLDNGNERYVAGYLGKMQCIAALYFVLASVVTVPLYAFGCLVEDVAVIKEKMQQEKEN